MAKIILNKPFDEFDITEKKVVSALKYLPDDWHILCGFHYKDGNLTREGDLLICGPDGNILVVDVKGFVSWRHDSDPTVNVKKACEAVGDSVEGKVTVLPALWVPNLEIRHQFEAIKKAQIKQVKLLLNDDLPTALNREIKKWRTFFSNPPSDPEKRSFFKTPWGTEFTQNKDRIFSTQIDDILFRILTSQFPLLDYLGHYDRMLLKGGPGSGKTWILIEKAFRIASQWSKEKDQKKILILCYNLPLRDFLKELVEVTRKKFKGQEFLKNVTFDIMAWEDLLEKLCKAYVDEKGLQIPNDSGEKYKFFSDEIPAMIELLLDTDSGLHPEYDALLVDEAQDQDTEVDNMTCGYWDLYARLLKDTAPVVVAYDPIQRPIFMGQGKFKEDKLKSWSWLGPKAIRVDCRITVRYAHQISDYLVNLPRKDGKLEFLNEPSAPLPPGDPVIEREAVYDDTHTVVTEIVDDWLKRGVIQPQELLIITKGQQYTDSGLKKNLTANNQTFKLVKQDERTDPENQIAWLSAGRCKGLDAKAVIVVGFQPYNNLTKSWRHSFCLAVSRARQLLAVVTNTESSTA